MTAVEDRKQWLLRHMGRSAMGCATMVAAFRQEEDRSELEKILKPCDWQVIWSGSCADAIEDARRSAAAIIISGRTFPDGEWRDIWKRLRAQPQPPMFILASRLADESLWSEVLNLGGYDLLLRPLRSEEVVRTVHGALMTWRSAQDEASTRLRKE